MNASSTNNSLKVEIEQLSKRKFQKRLRLALFLLIPIAIFVAWKVFRKPLVTEKYLHASSTRGDVIETVQASGTINPVTEVQIGAQVSGRVVKVFVDFNSIVKEGDVLAEIDPTLFNTHLASDSALVNSARSQVLRAEANLLTAKQRFERAQKLFKDGIGSQSDLDNAKGTLDVAMADVAVAKSQVSQAQATLKSSKTQLEYTKILAPIDGIVTKRSIDPGQTVAASFQAPTLFVIAQDLKKMRVFADIDEADVGKLKEGMRANVTVDAFFGEKFNGTIKQLRFSPVNVAGVVTYAAIIEVDNPELKLRPGMTATVTITTQEAKNTWKIPNAALRYKPTPPKDKSGKPLPNVQQEPIPTKKARIYVWKKDLKGTEVSEPRLIDMGISDGSFTSTETDLSNLELITDEISDNDSPQSQKSRRLF